MRDKAVIIEEANKLTKELNKLSEELYEVEESERQLDAKKDNHILYEDRNKKGFKGFVSGKTVIFPARLCYVVSRTRSTKEEGAAI